MHDFWVKKATSALLVSELHTYEVWSGGSAVLEIWKDWRIAPMDFRFLVLCYPQGLPYIDYRLPSNFFKYVFKMPSAPYNAALSISLGIFGGHSVKIYSVQNSNVYLCMWYGVCLTREVLSECASGHWSPTIWFLFIQMFKSWCSVEEIRIEASRKLNLFCCCFV